jgi:hypothetical protein
MDTECTLRSNLQPGTKTAPGAVINVLAIGIYMDISILSIPNFILTLMPGSGKPVFFIQGVVLESWDTSQTMLPR